MEPTLHRLVVALDAALTGGTPENPLGLSRRAAALEAARQQSWKLTGPLAFAALDDAYYLSDGGYSRLRYREEPPGLQLLSQSTPAAKARWCYPEVQVLVAELDALIGTALEQSVSLSTPGQP